MLNSVDTVQVSDPQQYCWDAAQQTMTVVLKPVNQK